MQQFITVFSQQLFVLSYQSITKHYSVCTFSHGLTGNNIRKNKTSVGLFSPGVNCIILETDWF